MPVRRAIAVAGRSARGSATLLGTPPHPRIARRLLVGRERSPAAGLTLVWPSGTTGSANPYVEPTRSCRREHAPAGYVPGVSAEQAAPVECQADAESHAACDGQRSDDAQRIRADPHSAPPPPTVGVARGSTVTHSGDGIEALRTNNSSSGYAPPIQPFCVCPICPAPDGNAPRLGSPGRCSPLSSRGVRFPGGVRRRPTARARRVIAFQRACAMSLMIRTSTALA